MKNFKDIGRIGRAIFLMSATIVSTLKLPIIKKYYRFYTYYKAVIFLETTKLRRKSFGDVNNLIGPSMDNYLYYINLNDFKNGNITLAVSSKGS